MTVVAKLFEMVDAPLIESKVAHTVPIAKNYEKGPGCIGFVTCWGDALFGSSSRATAELALHKLRRFVARHNDRRRELRVVVIGFSRGAAIARHFLNLVFEEWHAGGFGTDIRQPWSYAILFDTVATGQARNLNLSFPRNLDFAIHFLALNESRWFFEPIEDDDSDYESSIAYNSADHINPRRIFTVRIPGSHSDIGDSYQRGAGPILTALSKRLLYSMGLHHQSSIVACPGNSNYADDHRCNRTINEGLHDSRGLWDYLTFTQSPYSCNFKRSHAVPIRQSMSKNSADELGAVISERRKRMRADQQSILHELPRTENYVFGADFGSKRWKVLYPALTEFTSTDASISGDESAPTITLRDPRNFGKTLSVPSYVMTEVKRRGGSAVIEFNIANNTHTPWWFVDECVPSE